MAKYKKMHSINRIKNSKSKSIKHVKRGRKGKDCIYFNHEKLTCLHPLSPYHNCFCNSKECGFYKDKSPSKKPSLNHCQNRDDLSEFDRNYLPQNQQSGTHERTNEYITLSKSIGTPVHVGYLKSDGQRRHKSRCIYYKIHEMSQLKKKKKIYRKIIPLSLELNFQKKAIFSYLKTLTTSTITFSFCF